MRKMLKMKRKTLDSMCSGTAKIDRSGRAIRYKEDDGKLEDYYGTWQ
jgi:hypothetical protein